MPLIISESYADDSQKRARGKMSRNGHYQKMRRPTGLEVYNDASRILEELLEKRIDEDVRGPHRPRRNKTDPNSERVGTPGAASEKYVARSQTMPSRYRESTDEELRKKELDAILKKSLQRKNKDEESLSPVDTDDDSSQTTEKRKKKSIFKRAKERLMHTFHRDQKDGFAKTKEGNGMNGSPPKRRKMKVKKKGEDVIIRQSNNNSHIRLNEDAKYGTCGERKSSSYKDKSGEGAFHSKNRQNRLGPEGNISKGDEHKWRGVRQSGSEQVANVEMPDEQKPSPPPSSSSSQHPPTSSMDKSVSNIPQPPPCSIPIRPNVSQLPTPPPPDYLSSQSSRPPSVILKGVTPKGKSSSSSVIPSDISLESNLNRASSLSNNILDSPGDDIEYMDEDGASSNDNSDLNASGIKYHGSEGLLNFQWLADRSAENAKRLGLDLEKHEASDSMQSPDGDSVPIADVPHSISLPDVIEEEDVYDHDFVDGGTDDIPDATQRPSVDKEEMYGKIAQKLIEMADSYSASVSDPESRGAAAPPADAPLTELERQIIACLRAGGDRNTQQVNASLDNAKKQVKEDAYNRFRSTIQNSMGHEISWDHVAFLFHTTKGVVSAVGRGTKMASDAKEFTLQYVSDTFASWIVDQGGFDSMLSSSESDYELD